jgi:hypothetical protein
MLVSSKKPESEMVKVGQRPSGEWWSGAPTMGGSVVGSGLGAIGLLGGPIVGSATMAAGSALGSWLGSLFEPEPEDVMVEQFNPLPTPQQQYYPTQLGGSQIFTQPYADQYGVANLYGFG